MQRKVKNVPAAGFKKITPHNSVLPITGKNQRLNGTDPQSLFPDPFLTIHISFSHSFHIFTATE